MKRREFIALFGGAAVAAPRAARAQQKAMPVIGLLGVERENPRFLSPFRQGLGETGYVEGENVGFEHRIADNHYDRMPALAADLVDRKVDVIVTTNGTPWALAAKSATATIPIVFTGVGDPIGTGLVANLARPGGNLTGFTNISTILTSKQVQLLSELVPQAKAFVLLANPANPNARLVIRDVQKAIRGSGATLSILNASTPEEIDAAFASFVELRPDALVVDPDGFLFSRREQIGALALRHAVPAVYTQRRFVTAGGLISYGTDDALIFREAGSYAGRILKGAKPSDLPVQQPTKFELVINLKTAKALGLTVPQALLARADEVIE